MDIHDEISKIAYELYEKSGWIEGRDLDNWLEAEVTVKQRYKRKAEIEGKQRVSKKNRRDTKRTRQ